MKVELSKIIKAGFHCAYCNEVDIGNGLDLSKFTRKRSDKICRDCKPLFKKEIGKVVRNLFKRVEKDS